MMADDLATHFSAIDDPRCAGKVDHHLMDVLVIAVCATIAGSESWEDMGCQRSIAARIGDCNANYLIALKANQGRMFRAVQDYCDAACFATGAPLRPVCDSFDDSHGRRVRRRVFVCPGLRDHPALKDWPGLKSVLTIETIRSVNGRAGAQAEIRYFLASYEDDPAKMAAAIRAHWAIENSLHWVLDVTFREDECRVRHRTAAQNFAMLRKIALNLIKKHSNVKTSLKARRKKAAWDNEYMAQVITGKFHA